MSKQKKIFNQYTYLKLCCFYLYLRVFFLWSWRECSVVQKGFCFCREPTLGSQYQYGGAQLPVTPVPADLCALPVSVGAEFMECTYTNPGLHTWA